MVKVLRCHNFKSQSILPVTREPLILASGQDKVFIGTCDCFIEVFNFCQGHWEKYCSFQTGASVVQLEYNKARGYVAALECKKSRKSRLWDVVSTKVYLNWSIAHTKTDYRTRVRVAGLGYRSSTLETGNHLEVIDIPCEEPQHITTCQETGNLCVTTGGTVKIYRLVEKTIPNSYITYHDIEMFLQLSFELPVSMASLCEEYFACCTVDTAQVFKISYTDNVVKPRSKTADSSGRNSGLELKKRLSSVVSSSLVHQDRGELGTGRHSDNLVARQAIGSQRYSLIGDRGSRGSLTPSPSLSTPRQRTSSVEDDIDFIQWNFSDKPRPDPSGSGRVVPDPSTTVTLPGLAGLGKMQIEEPSLPAVKDLRGGLHQTSGNLTLKQVLFKYLDQSDHSWAHVQLIPTYLTGTETNIQSDHSIPVQSGHWSSLCGMCCMLSGARTGFMYSLLPESLLLSTYKYTTDITQLQTDGRLLYSMTENSLETYTARCQIMALHNSQTFDNTTKICPSPDVDTCMCGVQQFPGAKCMTMTKNHIILLTKLKDHDSSLVWNVYAIEESSAADLYRDMIIFGTRHQFNSADTYHHLLVEGHLVLRSSLIGQNLQEGEESVINDLMSESCALLGDFYALPNCTDWMLCLPYYMMSGLSPVDVVRQAVQHKLHSKQDQDRSPEPYGKGLVQYLRYVLFHGEESLNVKQSDGDLILSVCSEVVPDLLCDIILFSRLRNYTPETAYTLLQDSARNRSNMNAKTKAQLLLATASLNLQMCEPELAVASVSKIDQNDLVSICINHHQVLHTDFMELSPLSQLMRCHHPALLINILVMLFDRGVISLDLAIKLLQGKSSDGELHRNTHVRDYLEILVNDEGRQLIFDEAVLLLCDIYLKRLKEWKSPSCRELPQSAKLRLPHGTGHFGRRHLWLDDMPPFSGSQSIQKTCRYLVPAAGHKAGKQPHQLLQCQRTDIVCTCFLCNEDLLKMQSLLCSTWTTQHLADKALQLLYNHQSLLCYQPLYILCMIHVNIEDAVKCVIEKYPEILAKFGTAALKNDYNKVSVYRTIGPLVLYFIQWGQLLSTLLLKLQQEKDSVLYKTTLKEVLTEMTGIFSPEQFLQLLPASGNFYFFMPYIQMCRDKQFSHNLAQKIMRKGQNLEHCV